MSSNADQYDDQDDSEQSGESPILKKVRATLLKTAVHQWKEAGELLDPSRKYNKMVDNWEHIYLLELKKGFLVLRCSTPVLGQFLGGAYSFNQRALPNYTVELRDRNWDHRELTDIARRPAGGTPVSSKIKIETLASGDTARELFESVAEQVQAYRSGKDAEFEVLVTEAMKTLEELCTNGFTAPWQKKAEHGGTVLWYRTKMNEVQVAVGRQMRKDAATNYKLIFSNSEGFTRNFDGNVAKKIFDAADDYDENAGLLKLDALLKELE